MIWQSARGPAWQGCDLATESSCMIWQYICLGPSWTQGMHQMTSGLHLSSLTSLRFTDTTPLHRVGVYGFIYLRLLHFVHGHHTPSQSRLHLSSFTSLRFRLHTASHPHSMSTAKKKEEREIRMLIWQYLSGLLVSYPATAVITRTYTR